MRHFNARMAVCLVCLSLMGAATEEALEIAPVWSGHPVNFALLTHGTHQFVAFYDAERQLTVAGRTLDQRTWEFVKLPTKVGWDSHNYITMAVDDEGCVHLAGNMHAVPLIYFRMSRADDIQSFQAIHRMVGREEERCTYPIFMRGAAGELIFTYRHGRSGNGEQYFNVYDVKSRTWRRLVESPLTDGRGKRSAYFSHMQRGADGYFHVSWMWRDTPDASTNHDLSYARSKDLVHWENSSGRPLALPITLESGEVVDGSPVKGGMINVCNQLGFDSRGRVVISYLKYDAAGNSQIYNARREEGGWKVYQVSDWDYRWGFGGGGSLGVEISVGGVGVLPGGRLAQTYKHVKFGSGTWVLDETTMKVVEMKGKAATSRPVVASPVVAGEVKKLGPGMECRSAGDLGSSGEAGVRYWLGWETLGPNRDRPHEGPVPPPSMLRVYRAGGM